MDQAKVAWEAVKRYQFWVLLGVVVVGGLGTAFYTRSNMAQDVETRQRAIESSFSKLKTIITNGEHPNPEVIDDVRNKTKLQDTKSEAAWALLRDQQKRENELPKTLTPEFKAAFEVVELLSHREYQRGSVPGPEQTDKVLATLGLPPERRALLRAVLSNGGELDRNKLAEYQNFIGDHLLQLFSEGVKVRQTVEVAAPAGTDPIGVAAPPTGTERENRETTRKEGLVEWDEAKRKRILDRFHWDNPPTTEEVLLAQEDLWVYEALLDVVIWTNAVSEQVVDGEKVAVLPTDYRDCKVARIVDLKIGSSVLLEQGQSRPSATAGRPGAGGASPGRPGEGPSGDAVESSAAGEGISPLEANRYINESFEALAAGDEHPIPQFKMMPVRMVLLVDQTAITKLLTLCANSSMPIEVRRFAIRPEAGTVFTIQTSEDGERRGTSHGGNPWATTTGGNTGNTGEAVVEGSRYVPISIEGIITIYNPPEFGDAAPGETAPGPAAPDPEPPTDPVTPPTDPVTPTDPTTTPPTTPPTTP